MKPEELPISLVSIGPLILISRWNGDNI